MNADDMVRVVRALTETYADHSWIDFDIVPGIMVTLFEEFPHIKREAVLSALEADPPDKWEADFGPRVREHFGPRCFVVVEKDGVRRYWNSHRRELVEDLEDAIRFDDEEEAFQASERECGPLDGPHKDPIYKDAVVTIERVQYPEWTRCENPA